MLRDSQRNLSRETVISGRRSGFVSVAAATLVRMTDARLPRELVRYINMQHGAFSRKQALATGMSANAVDARVRRGTWHAIYPGVYQLGAAEPGRETRLWAALLYAGRCAVLSHQTAAHLAGLVKDPGSEIHVTVPAERRVRPQPGIRIHRSPRAYGAGLIFENPPRTSTEEALLDLTEASDSFDDVY